MNDINLRLSFVLGPHGLAFVFLCRLHFFFTACVRIFMSLSYPAEAAPESIISSAGDVTVLSDIAFMTHSCFGSLFEHMRMYGSVRV